MAEKLKGTSIPRSEGVVGWVVSNARPLRIIDASKDERFFRGVDTSTGYATRSILCVPLLRNSHAIGAIELTNKKSGSFTLNDERMLEYFASQASLSLEKARFSEDERNFEIHLMNILIDAIENISEKRGHAKRVARYAIMTANAIGADEHFKRRLYKASMLHDIGFLKIDIRKASSHMDFTGHPKIGYEMLRHIQFYSDIAPIVLEHHERYGGGGYPAGLIADDISLEARILAIAEAFDAMVSSNSYKNVGKVFNPDVAPSIVNLSEAIIELKENAGTQFDPELVKVFIKIVSEEDVL